MPWDSNPPRKKNDATEMPTKSKIYQISGEELRADAAVHRIKSRDESQKEVLSPTMSFAKLKQEVREGAWNMWIPPRLFWATEKEKEKNESLTQQGNSLKNGKEPRQPQSREARKREQQDRRCIDLEPER